jgi:hypothetical protein
MSCQVDVLKLATASQSSLAVEPATSAGCQCDTQCKGDRMKPLHTALMLRSSHPAIAATSARPTMIWSIKNRSASSALTRTR